jgi:hypothetical protein
MFAARGEIYTVHQKGEGEAALAEVVLVREGFSFWAFLFHVFWLLYQRQFLAALLFLPIYLAPAMAAEYFAVSAIGAGIAQLAVQVWLGSAAHDIQRATLTRKGYRLVDVVCAPSALLAEQRFLDRALGAV